MTTLPPKAESNKVGYLPYQVLTSGLTSILCEPAGIPGIFRNILEQSFKEIIVQSKKIIVTASIILASSMAIAESAPKSIDLSEFYERFEKDGYSSLELMQTTKRVLISGITLGIGQSFNGNSILKVGAHANSQELARLTAIDSAQENKLKTLQAGARFKAVCDLAFSSGAQYLSFQGCVFK